MQKAKLEKMKEDGKDEHDVKKMGEVALKFPFFCFEYLPTGVARDVDDDTRLSSKNRCSQGGTGAALGD